MYLNIFFKITFIFRKTHVFVKKGFGTGYWERVNRKAIPPFVLDVRYWFETYGLLITLSK